jgi:hypothetical protein
MRCSLFFRKYKNKASFSTSSVCCADSFSSRRSLKTPKHYYFNAENTRIGLGEGKLVQLNNQHKNENKH